MVCKLFSSTGYEQILGYIDERWCACKGCMQADLVFFHIASHIWAHSRQRDQQLSWFFWGSTAVQQNKASFTECVCVSRKVFHLCVRMFRQNTVERSAENSIASHPNPNTRWITPQHWTIGEVEKYIFEISDTKYSSVLPYTAFSRYNFCQFSNVGKRVKYNKIKLKDSWLFSWCYLQ